MDFLWEIAGNLLIYSPFILFFGAGVFLMIYSAVTIAKIYSCKCVIDGYCMEKRRERKGKGWEITHTFSYRYEGNDYYSVSKLGASDKLFNYLQQGLKYTIYINEKKPERYVVERKVTFSEIFTMVMGFAFAAVAVYEFFKMYF